MSDSRVVTKPAERDSGVDSALPAAQSVLEVEMSPVWEVVPGRFGSVQAAGLRASLRRDAIFRRSMALCDVMAAYASLLIAVVLVRSGAGDLEPRPTVLLLAPLLVVVSKAIGLYDRDQHVLRKTTIDEAPSVLHLAVLYALFVWLADTLLFRGALGRAQVFTLTVATFTFMIIFRSVARALAIARLRPEPCLVIGSAGDAARTAEKLATSSGVSASVVGWIPLREDQPSRDRIGPQRLGDRRALARVIREHAVERVIIAADGSDEEVLDCVRLVKALGIKVSVVPRLLEVVGSASTFDEVEGITLLGVRHDGLSRSSELLKRAMDIAGAGLGLVVMAPLFALAALAISIDSPGPVIFRQSRVGRKGDRFSMLKFRTMFNGADEIKEAIRDRNEAQGGLFKIGQDPRITRVGRFLRQTSFDEMPQLLNVLKGDMSLVGPRPLVQDEDALIEGWQRRRLAVKPGMTGLWQIFGSSRIPMSDMVKIDYLYGANWSIWLDLKILIRTVPYVLGRRGL
jgi:exopolysaccharide biosynthesis polyprenyl glycosylphosphotransferase